MTQQILIGLQEIPNSQLIVLSEKVIKHISLKRIQKVNSWADDLMIKLNKWSKLKKWWIGADTDYSRKDVLNFDIELFDYTLHKDFDLWEKHFCETWADELMDIAQHLYRSSLRQPEGSTYVKVSVYSRLLNFEQKYCEEKE